MIFSEFFSTYRSLKRRALGPRFLLSFLFIFPLLYVAATKQIYAAPETENLEVVVVTASRSEDLLQQVTRPIGSIGQEQLEITNHAHIQQVLNQQAGVNFHRNNGQETLAAIRSPVLTGAGACGEFLMLENGIPLRPSGMCNVNELFESHHEIAQRVEIVKGPASEFYGANALHGSVNILTKTNNSPSSVALTIGEHDYTKLVSLFDYVDWDIGLSLVHDGGFRDQSGFDQQKLTLSNEQKFSNFSVDSFLTLFNLNQETAGFLVGEDSYKNKAELTQNPNPEAYRDASGFRLYQKYLWNNSLSVSPFIRYSTMEFMQHFLPGQAIEENNQSSIGFQLQKTFEHETFEVTLGTDSEIAEINLLEYQDQPTEGSAFLQATIPIGKHYDYQVMTHALAPFLGIKMPLTDKLMLNAGVRAEYINFDYNNKMLSGRTDELGEPCGFGGCRFNRPDDRQDDFFHLSPKLSLLYSIDNNASVYVSLVNGFRTPQATELYRLQREQYVADLAAVELTGVDAGWRYSSNKSTIEIGIYDYKKSDAIIRNTDFFNIGGAKTSHQGIELALDYQLSPTFSVELNTTYNEHKYENNPDLSNANIIGLDVDTAPRRLANVFFNYDDEVYKIQLHGSYVSDYYTDIENQNAYPGHNVWHLHYQRKLNADIELGAQLLNVFDSRYAERADYSNFAGERYFPGEPRNIKLWMKYTF